MKRTFILILILFLLVGCNNNDSSNNLSEQESSTKPTVVNNENDTTSNSSSTEISNKIYEEYPKGEVAQAQNLYSGNGVNFELIRLEYDENSLNVVTDMENNTGTTQQLTIKKLTLDGVNAEQYIYMSIPNKGKGRVYNEISFDILEKMGKKKISEVIVNFTVTEDTTFDSFDTGDIVIKTNLDYEESTALNSNSFVIIDEDNIKVTGLELVYPIEEYESPALGMYFENNTDRGIDFSIEELLLNGYSIEYYLFSTTPDHTSSFASLSFDSDMLAKIDVHRVKDIDTLEFAIIGRDSLEYDEVYRSGRVLIEY